MDVPWSHDGFKADVPVHFGRHGTLEFLRDGSPSKVLLLDRTLRPATFLRLRPLMGR